MLSFLSFPRTPYAQDAHEVKANPTNSPLLIFTAKEPTAIESILLSNTDAGPGALGQVLIQQRGGSQVPFYQATIAPAITGVFVEAFAVLGVGDAVYALGPANQSLDLAVLFARGPFTEQDPQDGRQQVPHMFPVLGPITAEVSIATIRERFLVLRMVVVTTSGTIQSRLKIRVAGRPVFNISTIGTVGNGFANVSASICTPMFAVNPGETFTAERTAGDGNTFLWVGGVRLV